MKEILWCLVGAFVLSSIFTGGLTLVPAIAIALYFWYAHTMAKDDRERGKPNSQ